MNISLFLDQYWKYYLNLEKEVLATFEYSTLDKLNASNFSIEYAKLLQTICSEIDVVSKAYCDYPGTSNMDKMPKYASVITVHRPNIKTIEVDCLENRNCKYKPFIVWEFNANTSVNGITRITGTPPSWWTIYNKVKHERRSMNSTHRKENYKLANQDNVMNAIAGLFLIEMHFYKDIAISVSPTTPNIPPYSSNLFELKNWANGIMMPGGMFLQET
jgi:hypothetical protein